MQKLINVEYKGILVYLNKGTHMKMFLMVFLILLAPIAKSSTCDSLKGENYYKCKVYIDNYDCHWLPGRDFDVCRVYKKGFSCSSLGNDDYYKCKVYKEDSPCNLLAGKERHKCMVYRDNYACKTLKGAAYDRCRVYKEGNSCSSLRSKDYYKCLVYQEKGLESFELGLLIELLY